ncbi:hypothetical protein ACEPAI_7856 [Sanghuangporus weigelae]
MRRSKKNQIDSIVFDDRARLEFLTGFRKRKLLKKEAAKNKAKERERQERLQTRKEHRQALKERAEENARLVESAWKQTVGNESDDDDNVELSAYDKGKGKATQEFEDEQQLATVTIVEEIDPEILRHGSPGPKTTDAIPLDSEGESSTGETRFRVRKGPANRNSLTSPAKNKTSHEKGKALPGKVPYETKSARKVASLKQRARKLEKANLAANRSGNRRKSEKNIKKSKRR